MKKRRRERRRAAVRVVLVLALGTLAGAAAGCVRGLGRANSGALNVAADPRVPRPVRCRPVAGSAGWGADEDARLGAILRDSTASPETRAAQLRSAWPELTTFEPIEARACRLLATGRVSSGEYETFVDSVVPRLLESVPARSVADSLFRLRRPRLRTPPPGAVFARSPRHTVVEWDSVPGARYYLVEVQALVPVYRRGTSGNAPVFDHAEWTPHGDGLHSATTPRPRALFYFTGAQPGRWRVRAIAASGVASRPSEWREFTHTR